MSRQFYPVFCLEGDWYNDFNRSSTVKPMLKLLGQDSRMADGYIHPDVGTKAEFVHYCERWAQARNKKYPILYLAFHGRPNLLLIGDQRKSEGKVDLDELAEILGTGLEGRVVHFGSCETLATDKRNVARFLRSTGLIAASGYKESVDWFDSAVLDLLFFDALGRQPLTQRGVGKARDDLLDYQKRLCTELKFRLVVRD